MIIKTLTDKNYFKEQFTPKTESLGVIDFRLAGKPEVRRYDIRQLPAQDKLTAYKFVSENAMPFARFDGANLLKIKEILEYPTISWYQARQEWEISK